MVDSVRPPQPRPTPPGRTGPRPGWPRRVHPRTSEREFLAFLDRYGDLLRGCAYLMVGEPDRAERLASTVLARRYGAAADPTAALVAALRELVAPQPAYFDPPWASGDRVELRDAGASPPVPPLVAELQQLTVEQRAAVVLGPYAGLSAPLVAQALQRDVATVEGWGHQAYARLAAERPERRRPGQVASELRSAVTEHGGLVAVPAAVALGHGRRLVRRRRSRRATALVAAGVLVVAGGISVVDRSEVPSAATAPPDPASPSATADPHPGTVVASCDVKVPSCQATVMRDWRSRIAEVAADHVDPDRTYFTGYTFSYDPRYETTSFWAGRGGALGLEVTRMPGGATEVYLQIASDDGFAVRCGRTTRQRCESMRFLDGNRYSLSTGTAVASGIEVQYSPYGDEVITAVARNTTRGAVLEVTRGDLMNLVADPRLRLPRI